MTTEAPIVEYQPPTNAAGRLVIKYLQHNKNGATVSDILRYLKKDQKQDSEDLDQVVKSILENGMALGFLERKGSHFMNWMGREELGKRRGRQCGCGRRRRVIRRRSYPPKRRRRKRNYR